jgi:hypothetical protein
MFRGLSNSSVIARGCAGGMVERGLGGIVGRASSFAASRFALYHPG